MVLNPKNLNGIDEELAKRQTEDKANDYRYHREPFSRHLLNALIVLGILAVVVVVFSLLISHSR
ncbi:hypothetical protein [Paenibacillus pinistramenti]|uniref:hypothetical protein n=1 Tax=Paenibacillus pinistramenti TaxID=1768003 RepID=UPI001107C5F8|nr:hypothetical protein [Paenibacillus pinistramenti]